MSWLQQCEIEDLKREVRSLQSQLNILNNRINECALNSTVYPLEMSFEQFKQTMQNIMYELNQRLQVFEDRQKAIPGTSSDNGFPDPKYLR